MSTYYLDSDKITLGKYNEDGFSYIIDAIEDNSTYFNTGSKIWGEIDIAGLSKNEIWKLNERILEDALANNKELTCSHNPNEYIGRT